MSDYGLNSLCLAVQLVGQFVCDFSEVGLCFSVSNFKSSCVFLVKLWVFSFRVFEGRTWFGSAWIF